MKRRYIILFFALITLLVLTACTGNADTTSSDSTAESVSLPTPLEILEALRPSEQEGLTTVIETLDLTDRDKFKYDFFVEKPDSVKGAMICQPIIGSIPYFIGVLTVDTVRHAASLAEAIEDNINYNKLICASYEKAYVRAVGSTVVVILDIDPDRADRTLEKWEALVG